METGNKKSLIFARYLWLYGEIVGKEPVSFATINRDWMKSSLNESGNPLPHKTFENHRNAIQEMFGINIECDRSTNTYYVLQGSEPNFSKATMDMLNGALLFQRLQTNTVMHRFIKPEPCGENSSMLFTITDALEEGRSLKLRYRHNYDPRRETEYLVKPVAVKQFHRRWYLIAELADQSTYSFPLDRILYLAKGEKTNPSDIDVESLFADTFGIIRETSVPVEKVILKVEREQANYFISQPLHNSQKIIERNDEFVTFSLRVCPTYDFIMEILSHGPKVEVISPESLRNMISTKINEMSKLYSI